MHAHTDIYEDQCGLWCRAHTLPCVHTLSCMHTRTDRQISVTVAQGTHTAMHTNTQTDGPISVTVVQGTQTAMHACTDRWADQCDCGAGHPDCHACMHGQMGRPL